MGSSGRGRIYLASKVISGDSFLCQHLSSEAIPGFDQSQQNMLIPNVSVPKLVSLSFCQNERLAGCPTQLQVVRQRVSFAPRDVGFDCHSNLFFRNPLHRPASQDWIV